MRFLAVAFFFLFFGFQALAQISLVERNLYFDHLSIKDGLSQATVLCSWQDQRGFMWFGTRDGLNRYDGYSFEVFKNTIDNDNSIAGNIIYDINEDKEGNLWMVTDHGLSKFTNATSSFENYHLSGEDYVSNDFQKLLIDSNGDLWIGGRSGLFLFETDTKLFSPSYAGSGDENVLLKRPVYALSEGVRKKRRLIWVGTSRNGIYAIDPITRQINATQPTESLPKARVQDIVVQQDCIWIATYGDGLYIVDNQLNMIDHFHSESSYIEKQISHNNIRSIATDDHNNLWVGTFDGLDIFIDQHKRLRRIKYKEGDATGLSHGSIRSIIKDDKGTMWLGTYFGGVNIFDFDNQRFHHFYHKPGEDGSLSYNVVGAFSEDAQGNLMIGTERGGLNIYDKHNRNHQVFDTAPGSRNALSGNIIKSLYTDSSQSVWVGVFKGGLNRIGLKNGKVKKYPLTMDGDYVDLQKAIVNVIVPGDPGLLWLGTDRFGGLHCFDTKSEKYVDYAGSGIVREVLKSNPVKDIHIDGSGQLWLASRGAGVIRLSPETGEFIQFKEQDQEPLTEANHVYIDKAGMVWVSTQGQGLVRLDPETFELEHFYSKNGLPNDIILGVLEDSSGQLWVFASNGLALLNAADTTFKGYTYSSGFPLEEMNEGAFYKTSSGEFVVGGSNGYVRFEPSELVNNTFVPPVVFTHFKISNKEVLPGDKHRILDKNIQQTRHITLNHSQNVVTFEFAALSFLRPENNHYAYFLEGFDQEWSYVGNKRSITFTNLPEGDYVLKVKGSNNDGIWNETPSAIRISVLPPPWKTWWAFVLYGLLFVTGILLIRYNALKGIRLKHDLRVEQFEKEKWKEVHKLKLLYFTDVSHEFRTPLTLITSPLEEIMDSGKPGKWLKKRLKIMHFNAKRLQHLIDQILEIRELETGHAKLKLSPVRLDAVLGKVVDSFKVMADKKKIKLSYNHDRVPYAYLLDTDKLEKVFFNLLSNSFKFTEAGGHISLSFKAEKGTTHDKVRLEVTDTGCGMSQEHLNRIFERFYKQSNDGTGVGIGLSLTKSIVELLEGTIEARSEVGKGTTFYLAIPFERSEKELISEHAGDFEKPLPLEYELLTLPKYENPEEDGVKTDETLLVVEDNRELRTYLTNNLKKRYRMISAADGAEGLNKARKQNPSLIISDIMMPEMDGITLCETIKKDEHLCHIPVLLLTAKSSHVDRLEGLDIGADDYIAKPFIMKEVEARVKNIINNRNLLRKKYQSNSYLPDIGEITFNSYDEKLLKRIVEVVENNLGEPNLTVEYLAREVGLSRVQLFRKLKNWTGLSPAGFIRDFRMKRAAQLLSSKEVKVAEVAYEVGFQDVQYFSKSFKKIYGIGPKEYTAVNMVTEN
ncbi:response regulator [Fulvivirga sp. M361]|uniref:hybrid sensor histidine kinase/response regulator transcription factor n=1 Tax=Fulvivirga sp. M361 TaxID=2594266 RepID=UPI00117A42A5|nr:hybrid sensor histidine kinase/response regulator transcription factor [Fulvivirga sp. M361]TRX51183.1 response regulator [Fulvivirga sp. M361]